MLICNVPVILIPSNMPQYYPPSSGVSASRSPASTPSPTPTVGSTTALASANNAWFTFPNSIQDGQRDIRAVNSASTSCSESAERRRPCTARRTLRVRREERATESLL